MKPSSDEREEAIRLAREGVRVTFPVKGQSMLPFIIGGKESVILRRPGVIDVDDVVLAEAGKKVFISNI